MVEHKMTTSEDAVTSPTQHTSPCHDCPFRRTAINGWLGGLTAEDFITVAHTDTYSSCHVISNQQCAGMAIYRRNVCKRVEPPLLKLEADRELVFSTPMEFRDHHTRPFTGSKPCSSQTTGSKKSKKR